jgi:hypothetical protein
VAEFFADLLLTPLEATRIRLVSNPKYATGLIPGFTKLASQEGLSGLYAGCESEFWMKRISKPKDSVADGASLAVIPILCKQIPYAIVSPCSRSASRKTSADVFL